MTVNNGGKLSKEYFVSYIQLVMNARTCSVEEACRFVLEQFFKGNKHTFGDYSYGNFLSACKEIACFQR
ncbi:hypothetical protein WAX74_00755 [Psychrobacillus sp. FJAT-51614]|uniref:Uncharacterized protein n=1 Tax=Psychrobacillus mangrovi TaxID=3117745 RepID=A0ABU8EZK0_9BACI